MGAVLVDSDSFAFNDGNAGHVCDLGSSPSAGQWDVLCVNSNTTVSTPAGWTAAEVAVTNQGAYIFVREAAGGEGSTVTITTSGNHNTTVGWSRWGNADALDTSTNTEANSSTAGATPAHSTGTLAETGELAIAFGALHSIQGANQNTPVWSAGYTPLTEVVQSSGASGVRQYIAYRTDAGTAAETPQVSWSGDGCFNRYMLVVTFTSGGLTAALGTTTETDSAFSLARSKVRGVATATEADAAVALGRSKVRTLGLTTETGAAQPFAASKARTLGLASDSDSAMTLGRRKVRALGTAEETDIASSLGGAQEPAGTGPRIVTSTRTARITTSTRGRG